MSKKLQSKHSTHNSICTLPPEQSLYYTDLNWSLVSHC